MTPLYKFVVLAAVGCLGSSACIVKSGVGAPPPSTPPSALGTATSTYPSSNPGCEQPQNHCLPDDVYIVADTPWKQKYVYAFAGRMVGEPGSSGEATFLNLMKGTEVAKTSYYKTTRATVSDLAIGRFVAIFHNRRDGMYVGPETTKDAVGKRWWIARIVSTVGANQGSVIVSGGYIISVDNLRLLDGDESRTAQATSAEDGQYLQSEHWIVADSPLGNKKYVYASIGVALQPPSAATKNEGEFIRLTTGEVVWSGNAWLTRRATKVDLKPGTTVFMPHHRKGDSYVNPGNREQTIAKRWWMSRIVDTSELYKGSVTVAGGYRIAVDALRVAN